jgi:MoaD family protein
MQVKIRLFDRLRDVSGKSAISENIQEHSTLRELIETIAAEEGLEVRKLLLDFVTNTLLSNVNILVNGRHNRFTGGLETELKEGDTIDLLTAMSGG